MVSCYNILKAKRSNDMQIDPRTLGQLVQLQTMNGIDLQGTSVQNSTVNTDGSLFDILLQEMMVAEGRTTDTATTTMEDLSSYINGLSYNELIDGVSIDDSYLSQIQGVQDHLSTQQLESNGSITSATVATDIESLIAQAGQKYGVPASLIKAVIETESSFNPQAESRAGAKGLMQLMDGTARGLGVTNSFDPAQNIDGGTRYLGNLIKRYDGDLQTALAAYNAGPGRLQRLGISNDQQLMEKKHLLPQETQNYISKIFNARSKYEV